MNPNDLHTLRDVARALRQPLKRVRRWADTGRLATLQNGRQSLRLVPASELERLNLEGWYVDWTALADPDEGQLVQLQHGAAAGPYVDGMKPADVTSSETYQRVRRLKQQLADNRRALKDARHKARFYQPDDEAERRRIDAANEDVIRAKAAARVGEGTEEAVKQAQAVLEALSADIRRAKAEAREERSILEVERKLLEEKLAEATAALEGETAEVMRGAATRWLAALAAFVEANDSLHALEVDLEEAGVAPVVTAARDVTLSLANSREHLLPMLRRSRAWRTYYAAEVAEHRALANRTHLLKRDHEAAAATAARLAERQAKARASTLAAQQAAERKHGRPRRPLFFSRPLQ